jgi:hypothetical protein
VRLKRKVIKKKEIVHFASLNYAKVSFSTSTLKPETIPPSSLKMDHLTSMVVSLGRFLFSFIYVYFG